MHKSHLVVVCLAILCVSVVCSGNTKVPSSRRSQNAIAKVKPLLEEDLKAKGLSYGSPIFIRIFKETKELEVWVERKKKFELFRTYEISDFSGELGPKLREGDCQAPEGFY